MADKEDRLVQLWISHNDFFWQQVRAIPFVEALFLGGAYKLYKDGEHDLSIAVLSLGVILFILIALMINRHKQHANKFREEAGNAIPNPGDPFLGIRSDFIAVTIPLLLAILNLAAIYYLHQPFDIKLNQYSLFGLILDFVGIILLLIYSEKTVGATTKADKDFVASPWWHRAGYLLLALGFLLQIFGGVY